MAQMEALTKMFQAAILKQAMVCELYVIVVSVSHPLSLAGIRRIVAIGLLAPITCIHILRLESRVIN